MCRRLRAASCLEGLPGLAVPLRCVGLAPEGQQPGCLTQMAGGQGLHMGLVLALQDVNKGGCPCTAALLFHWQRKGGFSECTLGYLFPSEPDGSYNLTAHVP